LLFFFFSVHPYLINVLIDILHSLPDPTSFSRLVHSGCDALDPKVTRYLTFHTSGEECTPQSIRKLSKTQLRVKNIPPSAKHPGLMLVKGVMKQKWEATEAVKKLSSEECLPLVEQMLRYLDELVHATEKLEVGVG
jgi:hypothetical protein